MNNTCSRIILGVLLFLIIDISIAKSEGNDLSLELLNRLGTSVTLTESNLPILIFDTQGQNIPDEPKITAFMKVINNASGINNVSDTSYEYNGYVGIEIRGNTSQMYDKKSYTVETRDSLGENNNVSLLGLPKENDWVLHGPYSDKSLMRNVMAYHIGNAMGRWSPRTRFCEVVINGNYRGIYVFVEKIKIDKNRVDIATLKEIDISGDELTGGYIMSIDRDQEGSWNSPFMGRTGSVDVPISYVDPKYDELKSEQRAYIKDYITDFEYALDGDDYKDPELGYRAYIDVESFVDYMIITELSRDLDGYRVSVFFHKDKDSKGGKLTMSPFWDYNLCFGNANFMQAGSTTGWAEAGIGAGDWYEIPFWWDKFRTDPYYETVLKYRWEELREGVLNIDSLNSYIDSCVNVVSEAQERNFTQFNILSSYVWPNNYIGGTYAKEITYLKNWFRNRIAWLDAQMDKIEPSFSNVDDGKSIFDKSIITYPNPFEDLVTIEMDMNKSEFVEISIFDVLGKLLIKKEAHCSAGKNYFKFQADDFGSDGSVFIYHICASEGYIGRGRIIRK